MPERDILLERLERKLAEKEREVEELRKMSSFDEQKITQIKSELLNELRDELSDLKKVKELEAKVIELSKSIESLTSEVLYLKAELKRLKIEKEEIIGTCNEKESREDMIICD
jgi:multidrug resistance efflux pump